MYVILDLGLLLIHFEVIVQTKTTTALWLNVPCLQMSFCEL